MSPLACSPSGRCWRRRDHGSPAASCGSLRSAPPTGTAGSAPRGRGPEGDVSRSSMTGSATRSTSSPLTRVLGVLSLVGLATTAVLGLTLPRTVEQHEYSRLIAIHPPLAW